jgi:GNAT superfamily N-acetyltransferase
MMACLLRVSKSLPDGFEELRADAEADGHQHIARLVREFSETPAMFHAVFAAYIDGYLVGVGAITDEPQATSEATWRMRRLYVHRKFRRRGVARALAAALLQQAADRSGSLRCTREMTPRLGSGRQSDFIKLWTANGHTRQQPAKPRQGANPLHVSRSAVGSAPRRREPSVREDLTHQSEALLPQRV